MFCHSIHVILMVWYFESRSKSCFELILFGLNKKKITCMWNSISWGRISFEYDFMSYCGAYDCTCEWDFVISCGARQIDKYVYACGWVVGSWNACTNCVERWSNSMLHASFVSHESYRKIEYKLILKRMVSRFVWIDMYVVGVACMLTWVIISSRSKMMSRIR